MNLLLVISGNSQIMLQNHSLFPDQTDVVRIDEKMIATPQALVKLLKAKSYQKIFFGCEQLGDLRFGLIYKIYLFFTPAKQRGILDEHGGKMLFSYARFFFIEMPALLFEILVSVLVIFIFTIWIRIDHFRLKSLTR